MRLRFESAWGVPGEGLRRAWGALGEIVKGDAWGVLAECFFAGGVLRLKLLERPPQANVTSKLPIGSISVSKI